MIMCDRIRKVENGYIVEAPWPYGGNVIGCGEVACRSFDDVVDLLRQVFHEDAPPDRPAEDPVTIETTGSALARIGECAHGRAIPECRRCRPAEEPEGSNK